MKRMVIGVTLIGVALLALPARANYLVTAKLVCYDAQSDKLARAKRGNADLIAKCIGEAPTSPLVADYAVTFDSDTRELHVLRRCDGAAICDLSNSSHCETIGDVGITSKSACLYDLLDIGSTAVHGTLLCTDNETYSFTTHKYTYKASCAGTFSTPSESCTIGFKTGKAFDTSGSCPLTLHP
jgi:hypothetical protein